MNHKISSTKNDKIKIAIAEDINEQRSSIITAIHNTKKYELSVKATNGRDLILKLKRARELPKLLIIDMLMPCCDGLLTTIICKRLFPKVKIVALSNHTDDKVVSEFYAEGGKTFLSKYIIVKNTLTNKIYNDANIFENALDYTLNSTEKFIDVMLEDDGSKSPNRVSTESLILKNLSNFKCHEITYLQLNAAGFSRLEIAELMNKSESTIQKYFNICCKYFNIENRNDLNNISINFGIVKLVRLYQSPVSLNRNE